MRWADVGKGYRGGEEGGEGGKEGREEGRDTSGSSLDGWGGGGGGGLKRGGADCRWSRPGEGAGTVKKTRQINY